MMTMAEVAEEMRINASIPFEGETQEQFNVRVRQKVREYRAMPYPEYLKTDHWRDLRQEILTRDERWCARCHSEVNLNVHHKTYERLGEELWEDLIVLCRRCHELEHGIGKAQ